MKREDSAEPSSADSGRTIDEQIAQWYFGIEGRLRAARDNFIPVEHPLVDDPNEDVRTYKLAENIRRSTLWAVSVEDSCSALVIQLGKVVADNQDQARDLGKLIAPELWLPDTMYYRASPIARILVAI